MERVWQADAGVATLTLQSDANILRSLTWKSSLLIDLMLCVFLFLPAQAFQLKAAFRLFEERMAIGGILIRQDLPLRKRLRAIRSWFGIGIVNDGSASVARDQMQHTKRLRGSPTT